MQVRHRFARILAIVKYETETRVGYTQLLGYLSRFKQKMAQYLVVFRFGFGESRDWLFWHNQYMSRRLRLNILERQDHIVLVYDCGWDFPGDNLFKQGLAHRPKN